MANISPQMVKELREKTGAGMMDCKAALVETSGNSEAAVDWLRKKGLAKAAKKASRIAADGLVAIACAMASSIVPLPCLAFLIFSTSAPLCSAASAMSFTRP